MSVSYVTRDSNPVDNNARFDTQGPFVLTFSGLLTGDLFFLQSAENDTGATHSIVAADGQTITANTMRDNATARDARSFYGFYNSALAGTPGSLTVSCNTTKNTDFNGFSFLGVVFRATSGVFAVDQAESASTYAAPGSPFDVTISGQTATNASGVNIAWVTGIGGIPTLAIQTGGWSNPGGVTQVRNTANSDLVGTMAYRTFSSAGASGNVVIRQSATGYPGWGAMMTFYEVPPAGGGPLVGGCLVGGTLTGALVQ